MKVLTIANVSLSVLLGCTLTVCAQQPPETNPFLSVSDKTIMVITPHPDDDTMGCGGALGYLTGHHNRLVVVFITAGEKGTLDASLNPEAVRTIRMQEAAEAYRVLGFPDAKLLWLGYEDGDLAFAPLRELRIKLTHLIREHRPDVVFGLDPGATYYRYHYRDHRVAALLTADAIGAAMWPLEYPRPGLAVFRVPEVYYFYTAEPNLKLDISGIYQRKLDALAQHRSQFPPRNQHYQLEGPPPSRKDLESLILPLTGSTTTELFRRR